MPTTATDLPPSQAERWLVEALIAHIDNVADNIRTRAARQAGIAKAGLDRLAEEYDDPDPLVQALIEDARADLERVPDFFAAVARSALGRQLGLVQSPEPEETRVIEGTVLFFEVDDAENEPDSQEKGDN
jgi:hypothetical protein